jgi:hypothetical protein
MPLYVVLQTFKLNGKNWKTKKILLGLTPAWKQIPNHSFYVLIILKTEGKGYEENKQLRFTDENLEFKKGEQVAYWQFIILFYL